MSNYPELKFLDLEDVSKEEREEIEIILQSDRASLILPWVQPPPPNSLHNYESNEGECYGGSNGGGGGQQPPSSLHQVYQPQVLQLSYLPPTSYFPQQPHQVFEGPRRRGNKASPKRSGGGSTGAPPAGGPNSASPGASAGSVAAPPPGGAYPPLTAYPYHPALVPGPVPPGQYQYVGGAMQAAQHATGHPLFLTPQIPVYTATPPHMYPQYPPHQQVYNPALHSGGGLPGNPPDRIPKPESDVASMPGTTASPHLGTTSAPPLGVAAPLPGAVTSVSMGTGVPPPGTLAALTTIPPPGVMSPLPITTVSSSAPLPPLPGAIQPPLPFTHQLEVDSVIPPVHRVGLSGSLDSHHQLVEETPPPPRQRAEEVSAVITVEQRTSTVAAPDGSAPTVVKTEAPSSQPQAPLERHVPSVPPSAQSPPSQIDSETKSNEVQESVSGATKSKLLPPLSAIKTTSLPPSGAIKTKSAPLPTASSAPQQQQSKEEASPLHHHPISQGCSAPSPVLSQTGSGKVMGSWAELFKSSGSSSYMVSLPPPSSAPSHPVSVTESHQGSGHAAKVVGTIPKGKAPLACPPQNSMVVQPPPLLSSSNYMTSQSPSPSPSQQHSSSSSAQPPRTVCPPPGHSVANSQDPTLTRIAEVLSEYEPETRAVVLTPRGLNNPSNYCYINATLQALLACAPFYNLISTLAKHKPLHQGNSATPIIDSMIEFVREFNVAPSNRLRKERCEKAQARKDGGGIDQDPGILPGPSFEPSYVYSMVHNTFSLLQLQDRQEDAEEFLSVLLNGLNDEMVELLKLRGVGLSNGEVTTNGDSPHTDPDNSDWKEVLNNKGSSRVTRRTEVGRTPVTDIFMGQLRSRVERSDPQLSTDNIEPFYSLHLDVENCKTVVEALARMTSEKAVEGGEGGLSATTACYLDHCPLVLILHLKCFHYSDGRLTKIAKALDFPIDLKLQSKLQSSKSKQSSKATAYKLFAVVYHEGKEATKGHYVADVYHVGSSCWIRYDDAQVKSVSEQHVLNSKPPRVPYLLLYRRIDKHARS